MTKSRPERAGLTTVESLVALALVACAGLVALGEAGGALAGAVGGSAAGAPPSLAAAVASEAGTAGALARLASRGHGEAVADAARQAERAAESAGLAGRGGRRATKGGRAFTADLRPAASAVFGDKATKPVVKAWSALLEDATDGHAVLMTEFTRAAAALLEPDPLARLLAKTLTVDVGMPLTFERLDVHALAQDLATVLMPFNPRKRLTLLESLAEKQLLTSVPEALRVAVAADPGTRSEILVRLLSDDAYRVRSAAERNPSIPLEELTRRALSQDAGLRETVAENPALPAKLRSRLLRDENPYVRLVAAANPGWGSGEVPRIAASGDTFRRHGAARNPSAPPWMLAHLAADADVHLQQYAAAHRATPSATLGALASSKELSVRRAVAANPSAPPDVLARLAGDADRHVRADVAQNPAAPPEVIAWLERDAEGNVRDSVARRSEPSPSLSTPLPSPLTAAVAAARHGVDEPLRPRLTRVSAWDHLPMGGPDYVPYPGLAGEAARIDGAHFTADGVEHEVRVLSSKGELEGNGTYMGNCTGEYCEWVADGQVLIAAIAARSAPEKTLYNVEWRRDLDGAPGWSLTQQQRARHEKLIASEEVKAVLASLTERLNGVAR